jgi:hypothetical protein
MLSVGLQAALRVPLGEPYPLVSRLVDQFALRGLLAYGRRHSVLPKELARKR